MKREHYELTTLVFDLERYHSANSITRWDEKHEGMIDPSNLVVCRTTSAWHLGEIVNGDGEGSRFVFVNIPTRCLAEEIVAYIKQTEVFFL